MNESNPIGVVSSLATQVAPNIAAYRERRYHSSRGENAALSDAYDDANDEIYRLTGERLPNPKRDEDTDIMAAPAIEGADQQIALWNQRLSTLAQSHPELARQISQYAPAEMAARAARMRQSALQNYDNAIGSGDVADRVARSVMTMPGAIAGGVSAGSPEEIGQLAAGGSGKGLGLAERAALGALTNTTAALPAQQVAIEDAHAMGRDLTTQDIGVNLALTAILGGALGALHGGHGPERAVIASERTGNAEPPIGRVQGGLSEMAAHGDPSAFIHPLNEPGSGTAAQEALAGRAESLIVAAAQRDRVTLAEAGDVPNLTLEQMADNITANDAYVRGDSDLPARTEPVREAPREEVEAAARQADNGPVPHDNTREEVTYRGQTRPRTFMRFNARDLHFDPQAFQYKRSNGPLGSTGRLDGVEVWDPQSAGKIVVYEGADGRLYVADGHQRVALAQALAERDQQQIQIDGYLYREKDGWSQQDVRAIAAQKNLREGVGDPVDAAQLMRDAPDVLDSSVPQRSSEFRTARALARLAPEAWAAVRDGSLDQRFGAIIGEHAADRPDLHAPLADEFRRNPPNSAREASFIVREAMIMPVVREHAAQLSMFDEPTIIAGMAERAAVLREAVNLLRADKQAFAAAERFADQLEANGNVLAHEANARKEDAARALLREIVNLATRPGPVADMLRGAVERARAAMETPKEAARQFVDGVTALLNERGLLGLYTEAPPRPAPPSTIEPVNVEAAARSATLRNAHDMDEEALTQTMAEVALERALRGEVGDVVPEEAIGAQHDADMQHIEDAAEALGLEPDYTEQQVAAAIFARGGDDLRQEATDRLAPEMTSERDLEPATESFAEAAEHNVEVKPLDLPLDAKLEALRASLASATLPELDATLRQLGADIGAIRTRTEYENAIERAVTHTPHVDDGILSEGGNDTPRLRTVLRADLGANDRAFRAAERERRTPASPDVGARQPRQTFDIGRSALTPAENMARETDDLQRIVDNLKDCK